MTDLPILYSLHNCPYAMRARTAIIKARQPVLIRSVKLDNKPPEMLQASPKGSVPVLVLPSRNDTPRIVIEESLELMLWALAENDPDNLLRSKQSTALPEMVAMVAEFEHRFIPAMNAFGCARRYHEPNTPALRRVCEGHLATLEEKLTRHACLYAEQLSLVDIALLPFLRKFARIDKQWFRTSPYPNLRNWLNQYLTSSLFSKVMTSHELWLEEQKDILFGVTNRKK